MIRIPPEALHSWSTEVLAALGVSDNDATHIARCLVDVDLRGVRSHGTRQLRRYVKEFRNGLVNTTPVTACCVRPTTVSVWTATAAPATSSPPAPPTAPATRRMRSVSLSPPRATTGMWAVPAFTLDVS